jgi:large subunit ribosomal protein L24
MKLKKGDTVVVIAGKDKGSQGEIAQVLPKDNKVIIAGSTPRRSTRSRARRTTRAAASTVTCRSTRAT